ncbi:MAG: NADH ubiquinone oxidoreductase chain A [uncultured Acidimicrobiales bacterium]|uniref:NADH-quinone oxidoreductase subunit A n=1 Tax=uncultured Acidimicrobiales bacterium TaxID=310071 RepID=A0A6J4HIZ3_9ACTN|nr:MAG: NADH ubiquinone oxidoreductase chain A [uncultured Acidimicrobiales bacterium]
MDDYLPLVVMFVLAVGFVLLSIASSKLLAPSRPTSAKDAPYESGIVPTRDNPERFPVTFYLVAMIFIVFDIEIIFLYPWAVIYRELGAFGLVEMLVFSVAVFVAFVYLISNGALDWGPLRRSRRLDGTLDGNRTSSSTIRRIPSRTQVEGEAAPPAAREEGASREAVAAGAAVGSTSEASTSTEVPV